MKRILITIGVLVLLLPVIVKILPQKITLDQIVEHFRQSGLQVTNVVHSQFPELEAEESITLRVDGASVVLCRYRDDGKLVKNMEFQRQDVGSAIAESMGLRQALGAAPPPPKTSVARKGKILLVVTSADDAARNATIRAFNQL